MHDFLNSLDQFSQNIDNFLWAEWVLYSIVGVGILFTIWSAFGQYRALTHGVAVVRGKYDRKTDPGAINHFQALSAALSATVGLGNIGGVALAISLGGPGAVFWMWVIGFVGMAIKMTEVSLSMLYRDTSDPDNPKGGPMWVVYRGFEKFGLKGLGWFIALIFVFTLIVSTITGGNMFQAWNVADVTWTYFNIPKIVTGIILTLLVGLTIIGGIKRIGAVAGRLVPFMCIFYFLACLYVLLVHWQDIPHIFSLIFTHAFAPTEAQGAFLGGSVGYVFLLGMKRALFSNEAGQGSAPIAHSAAKTDEPIREGVVAGLEPFIDTLVICTLTAFAILASGAWNREPDVMFPTQAVITNDDGTVQRTTPINPEEIIIPTEDGKWTLNISTLPKPPQVQWLEGQYIYAIVNADPNQDTGNNLNKVVGIVHQQDNQFLASWIPFTSSVKPTMVSSGIYIDYTGASLTSFAFDLVQPGLGMWLVTIASWLFAISTMISWSYYGEQGIIFLFGNRGWVTLSYKLVYCFLIIVSCLEIVRTTEELERWSSVGTGVMLFANIPICLIFGYQTMRAYHTYIGKLKAGKFHPHKTPSIVDVVEGKDG